ncbi:serine hydrolase [Pontibacter silvestris]|uniref:Serine hydrolase n=1 Tax=Pontibacter silvestris TaxID=2305183 RepID=A0ABW4WSS7_9BACT|nr:serine hydrolase [Pontibacter silvestris]MCC9137719.1 class A beta-lactamase-related serine hydrolase [Pontibacter silvestris]
MTRFILALLLLLSIYNPAAAQQKTDAFLKDILTNAGNDSINRLLSNPDEYRLQIIYTQINRDKKNKPSFQNYYFNYDPNLYFNPASTVKLPLAFLSLEKLNTLGKEGIDKHTPLVFDSSYVRQKPLYTDVTSASGLPSIAHFIRRAFLISENDPYNRLYQFVGQQGINRSLHGKGYKNSRIVRQFMGFTTEQNRHTNAIRFLNKDGSTRYYQPPAYNPDSIDFSPVVLLGKAHYNSSDSLVNAPFDFTRQNKLPLEDLQQLLQSVMVPASVPKKQRFNLSKDDYTFIYQYLSQYPSETPYPKYDSALFYDSYVKFFFRNSTHRMPEHVRVFNKVGWAYGFLTDVSYVVDFENQVEYMLAATLYVNSDDVVNDGKYDYDTIGYPFLYNLGQIIYNYELSRERKYKADLSAFQVQYEQRDVHDTRPSLREVDN